MSTIRNGTMDFDDSLGNECACPGEMKPFKDHPAFVDV